MGETHRRARLWVPVRQALRLWARLLARLWVPVGVPATVGVPVVAPAPQALSDRYLFPPAPLHPPGLIHRSLQLLTPRLQLHP